MKAVVYGIGKGYLNTLGNADLAYQIIDKNDFEVIGFSDGNKDKWGMEIVYNGQKFIVRDISEFRSEWVDYILITTHKFFNEIRVKLLGKGYEEKQILPIEKLYNLYMEQLLCVKELEGKAGVEIGGPTDLFSKIYDNCLSCDNVNFSLNTAWCHNETNGFYYKGKHLGNILVMDATNMSGIEDKKYDFVLSSNNLEHIANPLKALKEFSRIVKVGGLVEVIVPRKEDTFDHNREYTTFEHLCEDYENGVSEEDLMHLPEIIEKHDYDMDIACGGKDKFIERAQKNFENRCLHHHVFNEQCLRKSLEFAGFKIRDCSSLISNFCIIGEKTAYL